MATQFIGIGAQKCASTWVYAVLREHPQIFHSEPKELDFFSHFYGRGSQWYARFFEKANHHLAVGENSPSYFHHPLAPERARRHNSDFKILVVLRDPIERAFSNHLHLIKAGYLKGPDFTFEYGLSNNPMYLEQSRYATHLSRWLSLFPREQVLVTLQEDIQSDPESAANQIYQFLEVGDHALTSAGRRSNESRTAISPALESALALTSRGFRAIGLTRWLANSRTRQWVDQLRKVNTTDLREVVPPMSAETRSGLTSILRPEVEELSRLLNRSKFPWKHWWPDQ